MGKSSPEGCTERIAFTDILVPHFNFTLIGHRYFKISISLNLKVCYIFLCFHSLTYEDMNSGRQPRTILLTRTCSVRAANEAKWPHYCTRKSINSWSTCLFPRCSSLHPLFQVSSQPFQMQTDGDSCCAFPYNSGALFFLKPWFKCSQSF